MPFSRVVPAVVMGLGVLLAAAGLITYANSETEYADLVPAPDSIVWGVEDQTTLWLSTNLHDVEMHIDSVALGIDEIDRVQPGTGETQRLGNGLGCQDWVVSSLSATVSSAGAVTWTAEVLRDGYTGDAVVHVRARGPGTDQGFEYTVSGPDTELERTWNLAAAGEGAWAIDASSNEHFPTAITRSITADTETRATTTDEDAEFLLLLENTGVSMIACSEHEDVGIRLVNSEGEELNRYLIDVGPAPPAPTATPVPTPTPNPYAGSVSRRICVDDDSDRHAYLDGGENVGAVFDHDGFGLTNDIEAVSIGEAEAGALNRYFFESTLTTGDVQLTVSEAGAADTQGLDNEVVYQIRLTASDDTGQEKFLDVAVWLDTSTVSPNGDGLCS